MEELNKVVGGTFVNGGSDDDILIGTDGNDLLLGRDGEDILYGGDGNDVMDGGVGDGADDVAFGGHGNDTFFWGLTKDGSDTFIGGEGNDSIGLDLESGENDIKAAFDAGEWNITIMDANNNPVQITDDMWNSKGQLILPPGSNGQITGSSGETLTFSGVEIIK